MKPTLAPLAALALLAAAPAGAQDEFSVEGRYELIQPAQPTETPGKVEIVDVFWYGCPHCYRFLPLMERYAAQAMPEYAELRRMPAIFRKTWEIHARAFYVAEALGVIERIHAPLFDAIHVHGRKLDDRESLREFFSSFDVSPEEFDETWSSFSVDAGVRKSKVMQQRYGVRGTPSVIVAGKYRISGNLAGGYENMLKVIDALVDKEHEENLASR